MRNKALCAALVGGLLAASSPSYATLSLATGTFGGGNGGNVLFDTATSGTTILADLNGAGLANSVQFTSSTDTLVADASGQAVITAQTGLLNQVTITEVSPSFNGFERLALNVNSSNGAPTTFSLTAVDQFGTSFVFGGLTAGNGQNFYTINSDAAQTIQSVSFLSGGGVLDIRQVRVDIAPNTPVPGPIAGAGLPALLALGGLGAWMRRRKGKIA